MSSNDCSDALLRRAAGDDEGKYQRLIALRDAMREDHAELVRALDAGELAAREFADRTNDSTARWISDVADVVGATAIKEIFGVEPGEAILLVDPERMKLAEAPVVTGNSQHRIAILALVVGVISLGWNVVRDVIFRPPSPTPVLGLIEREAHAAMSGDPDEALELFADAAVIRSISPAGVWRGRGQIRKRYAQLPVFKELVHIGATIDFDASGVLARARTGMSGVLVGADGELERISSVRGEEWTFRRIEGKWMIVDFTYGLE